MHRNILGCDATLQSSWGIPQQNLRRNRAEPIMKCIVLARRGAGVDERARLEIA